MNQEIRHAARIKLNEGRPFILITEEKVLADYPKNSQVIGILWTMLSNYNAVLHKNLETTLQEMPFEDEVQRIYFKQRMRDIIEPLLFKNSELFIKKNESAAEG